MSKVLPLRAEGQGRREKVRSLLEGCHPVTKDHAKTLREIIATLKEDLALSNGEVRDLLGDMVRIEIG